MKQYHKIQTVFLRDPDNNFKTLLYGQYALPEFEYLASCNWVYTEKVDGMNIRVMFDGEFITFGGKTDRANVHPSLLSRLHQRFTHLLPLFKEKFPDGVCLYGEGYGPKIQKGGGNYRADQDFVLFDVKIGKWWLNRSDVQDVAETLEIDIVPVIGTGTLPEMVDMVQGGIRSTWGDFPAEGIIARPATELFARNGRRIITKLKARDFR